MSVIPPNEQEHTPVGSPRWCNTVFRSRAIPPDDIPIALAIGSRIRWQRQELDLESRHIAKRINVPEETILRVTGVLEAKGFLVCVGERSYRPTLPHGNAKACKK